MDYDSEPNEDVAPVKGDTRLLAAKWLSEISKAEKDLAHYFKRCEKINSIYTENRKESDGIKISSGRKLSILWSNLCTLQPAVYARLPKPVVQRRYRDRDPVARQVCNFMERSLEFNYDVVGMDDVTKLVRDDFLLFARGTAWARYEADFTKIDPIEEGGEPIEQVVGERVVVDHVNYRDFIYPKARTWLEVPWCARRSFLDKHASTKRFSKEVAEKLTYSNKPGDKEEEAQQDHKSGNAKAVIYEIWSKNDNRVYWVSPGYAEGVLEEGKPHLELSGFFPTPKPCFGTLATDSLVPVPDYVYYQDQAEEIDDLTQRISALMDALKLVGFYASGPNEEGAEQIEIALQAGVENKLIPVPSWAAWSEKGGVNQIQWLPVDIVVKVLQACFEGRKQLISDIYQITGISDIIRGESDPRETAAAQGIKAQWGSIRIKDRQAEIARYVRDLTRIMGEIIADKFQPETLMAMTGINLPTREEVEAKALEAAQAAMLQQMPPGAPQGPPGNPGTQAGPVGGAPQGAPPSFGAGANAASGSVNGPEGTVTIDDVMELMRDDRMRSFRIGIETDSTIQPDENEYKQRLGEFMTAVGTFIEKILPAAQQHQELIPFLGESLLTVVRGYRVGRQLEGALEDVVATLEEQAQAGGQRLDPASAKMQAEMAAKKAEAETQIKLEQMRQEGEDRRLQMKLQAESQVNPAEMQAEQQKAQIEQQKAEADLHFKTKEMELKQREHEMKLAHTQAELQMDGQRMQAEHQMAQRQMANDEQMQQRQMAQEEQRMGQEMQMAERQQAMSEHQQVHGANLEERRFEQESKLAAQKPQGGRE